MKDFFFFTKGQKIALSILTIVLISIVVANFLMNKRSTTLPDTAANEAFLQKVADFVAQLGNRQNEVKFYSPFEEKEPAYKPKKTEKPKPVLTNFDPNTLDSAGFVKLGLEPYVAKNVIKYRQNGAIFRKPDDFSKVFGLKQEQFEQLKPFIAIADSFATPKNTPKDAKFEKKTPVAVELNSADTTALKQLPGIGSGRAKQIVNYRRQLGGFSSPKQLLEINRFPEEVLSKIEPYLSVETDSIKPILVNRATVDKLRNHPYLNFYQAKAIYDLRKLGDNQLKSIEDLRNLKEFTPEELERVAPYLDFREIKYDYKYKK